MGITSSTDVKRMHENSESKSKNNQDMSKEQQERYYNFYMFMKGGGCKESVKDYLDCLKKNEDEDICCQEFEKCMEAHSDYYQPYLAIRKNTVELMMRDMGAYFKAKSKEETYTQQIYKFMTGPCTWKIIAWMVSSKHGDVSETMCKCMEAHPYHYQPYIVFMKSYKENYHKEVDAFLSKLMRKE